MVLDAGSEYFTELFHRLEDRVSREFPLETFRAGCFKSGIAREIRGETSSIWPNILTV